MPKGVVDAASVIVEGYAGSTEGFAFCLSENGDLLSQWRAYAHDGSGVSIGFSESVLKEDFGEVNFGSRFYDLKKVDYGEDGLREDLRPFVGRLRNDFIEYGEFIKLNEGLTRERALSILADREQNPFGILLGMKEASEKLLTLLQEALAPLHFRIYDTKPRSFREEQEWRVLRYRHRMALAEIEYSADDCTIRPYITCLMADPARHAVQKVVLGPKHRSDINWVRAFLHSTGLSHVTVERSSIDSYR